MRIDFCPSYVLHSRPFRDSSAIVECLSEHHGIVSLIAKGVRRPRSKLKLIMQPFVPLVISWIGQSELKTLTQADSEKPCSILNGQKILLGLYLNEIILRLLQKMDPHPQLFLHYAQTIMALAAANNPLQEQSTLRRFELKLLIELGYGLELKQVMPELLYTYEPALGLLEADAVQMTRESIVISGATLIALSENIDLKESQLKEARNMMRHILNHHLGNKPLQSRKLFVSYA